MAISGRFGHLQALLVEPSAMQAKIIRKVCDEVGLTQVQLVGSAADADAAMRAARPDVVLSALYLPDRSGTELLIAMRADPLLKHVAFILISSETRPAQAQDPILAKLLAEASNGDREMAVVVSFVEEDRRHRFYTVAAFLYAGEVG